MASPRRTLPISRTTFVHAAAQTAAPAVNMTLAPIMIFFLPIKSDPGPERIAPIAAIPKQNTIHCNLYRLLNILSKAKDVLSKEADIRIK